MLDLLPAFGGNLLALILVFIFRLFLIFFDTKFAKSCTKWTAGRTEQVNAAARAPLSSGTSSTGKSGPDAGVGSRE